MITSARFSISPEVGYAPLTVQITPNITFDVDGEVDFSYFWDFGDGTTSIETNPVKTYNSFGRYNIVLNLNNSDNKPLISPISKTAIVNQPTTIQTETETERTQQQSLHTFKRFDADSGYVAIENRTYSGTSFATSYPLQSSGNLAATADGWSSCLLTTELSGTNKAYCYGPSGADVDIGDYIGVIHNFGGQITYANMIDSNDSGYNMTFYKIIAGADGTSNSGLWTFDRNLPDFTNHAVKPSAIYGTIFVNGHGHKHIEQHNILDGYWETTANNQYIGNNCKGKIGSMSMLDTDTSDTENSMVFFVPNYGNMNLAESIYPSTFYMHIPHIMWHGNMSHRASNGNRAIGLKLFDIGDNTEKDVKSEFPYRKLRTGPNSTYDEVGRIYHSLKMAVITDQELCASLTYSSNRSYTLPEPQIFLTEHHEGYSGWVGTGHAYYVTYRLRDGTASAYNGSQQTLHCRYIQGPILNTDPTKSYSMQLTMPSHPWYAIDSETPIGYSGAGYTAQYLDIMVATGSTTSSKPVDGSWKIAKSYDISPGSTTGQILTATSNLFITYTGDGGNSYSAGTTYELDLAQSGTTDFTIGGESVGFATMSGAYTSHAHRFVAFCTAANSEFNNTMNPTYSGGSTYITSCGLYNDDYELLMIGKLTKPIEKNSEKFLTIKMELDF